MEMQSASTVPQLGELLRYWRRERGKSQLDLSLDTGIHSAICALWKAGGARRAAIFSPLWGMR